MVQDFEIIKTVVHHNRGLFIFARHLGENRNFEVASGSLLGDLPVYHYKDISPFTDDAGEQRKDIFAFRPADMERLFDRTFNEDDRVQLSTPD